MKLTMGPLGIALDLNWNSHLAWLYSLALLRFSTGSMWRSIDPISKLMCVRHLAQLQNA